MAQDGMEVVARFGRMCGSVWPDLSKNVIFQNPSKKMRLDESFRMVPVSCNSEVVVKSYGQITKIWPDLLKNSIFRNPSKKMRLDESFHLLPVACHNSIVVKSYGQITKITLRQIAPRILS